jgi:hypothetical protein
MYYRPFSYWSGKSGNLPDFTGHFPVQPNKALDIGPLADPEPIDQPRQDFGPRRFGHLAYLHIPAQHDFNISKIFFQFIN